MKNAYVEIDNKGRCRATLEIAANPYEVERLRAIGGEIAAVGLMSVAQRRCVFMENHGLPHLAEGLDGKQIDFT